MSQDDTLPVAGAAEVPASAIEFYTYCEAERERRRNTGESFDEALFDAAIELALRKFQALEDGGLA
ncbi:MAG: nodulation protein E [Gammaproteobacteria bacterium]|jgi:hypothetical protein|nr:nodulation protein E [Gammaproteobacteria bacterium]